LGITLEEGFPMSLSTTMRDVLIEHLDGAAVPIVRRPGDRDRVVKALILRGLLKVNSNQAKAPTHTLITEPGRAELAALLGEYADAIVRAKFQMPPQAEAETPMRLVRAGRPEVGGQSPREGTYAGDNPT
jgi:hypothetical protein